MSGNSEMFWRGIALAGLVTGAAALTLHFTGRAGDGTRAAAPTAPRAAAPSAPALAGRTASLSRLLPDRRAVVRIELVFGGKGVLGVTCRAESADGALSACFGDEQGTGTWSVEGTKLCVAAAALGLAAPHCYDMDGEATVVRLAGPGLLAGNLYLR
jgi:hypothetical protein